MVGRVQRDAARLYVPADVALLRVVVQALRAGVPMPRIAAALRYMAADVRDAFTARGSNALAFDWRGIARLVPMASAPTDGQAVIALSACWRGVVPAMRAMRRADPEASRPAAWNGWRAISGVEGPALA